MPIYQVVLTNFNSASQSDPKKTIAEVILDGSYSKKDLNSINTDLVFPNNNYNRLDLPEGAYTSGMAMMDFVRTIGPFLSDQALYSLTHAFAQIETENNTQSSYRTSTLAKCFAVYELERFSNQISKDNPIPTAFLSHMQTYILPLSLSHKTDSIESKSDNIDSITAENKVNRFCTFNFKNDLMDSECRKKYNAVGFNIDFDAHATTTEKAFELKKQVETNLPFYPLVEKFDSKDFKLESLSDKSEKDPGTFRTVLEELDKAYTHQKPILAVLPLDPGNLKIAEKKLAGSRSEPIKGHKLDLNNKKPNFWSNWFGKSTSEEKKAPTQPTNEKASKLEKRSTFSPEAANKIKDRSTYSSDDNSGNPIGNSFRHNQIRQSMSFIKPSIKSFEQPVRTIEDAKKELKHAEERLQHYTKLHERTAEAVSKFPVEDNSLTATDSLALNHSAKRKKYYSTTIIRLKNEIETLQQASQSQFKIQPH